MNATPSPTVPETALRFHLAVQGSRLGVMALMTAVAVVGQIAGLIHFDLRLGLAGFTIGAASVALFRHLYQRAASRGDIPDLHLAWMGLDTLLICWSIWITGDEYPLWLIWFLIHTAAAAFVAGHRAANAVLAASAASYLATLALMGRIGGFDSQLVLALGRLTLLFGSTYFMIRGIADLRDRRLQIAALHDEKSQRLEELQRLAAELDSRSRDLAEANLRAQEANRAKSQFLANMSHELRTPLNSIIGFSEILTERLAGRIEPRLEKFVHNILTSGKQLLGLINDILDLSKIEAGKMQMVFEPLSLGDLVRGVESVMHSIAAQKSITLDVQIARELPPIVADAPRIKQTLYNLVSNAVKFSPEGSTVTIRARRLPPDASPLAGPSVALEVEDRGVGIRREDQELIFDEFRQVDGKTSRNMGGTGLGLALVKRFVEMHGGVVTVDSEPGRGSRFLVALPVDASAAEARRAPGEPISFGFRLDAVAATPAPDAPLVLVAEDDDDFFASLAGDLRSAGYRVSRATRGDEALEMLGAEPPDALVLDLVLPVRDGWEVLKQVKADPATAGIPVLIVSVVTDHELGLALGADDYFLKPLDRRRFLDRLRGLIDPASPSRPRALVIDDDPQVHDYLGLELESAGFDVLSAGDGRSGIELARAERPDVIVLDLVMEGFDGFRVGAELQSDALTAGIPIVVFTSKELTGEERRSLAERMSGVLSKAPEDRRQLVALLHELRHRTPPRRETDAARLGD